MQVNWETCNTFFFNVIERHELKLFKVFLDSFDISISGNLHKKSLRQPQPLTFSMAL